MKQSRRRSLSLLHLPGAFLAQLLSGQYLDSSSKVAVFSSCNTLRDMVLQHSARTRLNMHLFAMPLPCALSAVKMTSKHSTTISLHLGAMCKDLCCPRSLSLMDVSQLYADAAWQFFKAGKKLGIMNSITHIELEAMYLDTLLPPAMAEACPNLRSLILSDCDISWDSTSSFAARLPKLQILQLKNIEGLDELDPWKPQLQQQLASLTALQQLSMADSYDWPEGYNVIAHAVASQLTRLHACCYNTYDDAFFRQPQWAQLSASLQHLQLQGVMIRDAELRLFLDMPALTHLDAHGISLDSCYIGQPCRWQEVTVRVLTAHTLARLPLHANLHLKGYSLQLGSSVADVEAAVVNVTKCQRLSWDTGVVSIDVCGPDATTEGRLWAQALPLVKDVEGLHFPIKLSAPIVQALRVYAHTRGPFTLRICQCETGHVISLISALSAGSTLEISGIRDAALVTQFCCAAPRPLTLKVRHMYSDKLAEDVQAAMRLCGHQHVKLAY